MALAEQQNWSAEIYAANARFVSELGSGVFEWLSPKAGERILDVGCGDGALTQKIADAGAIVTGVDLSPSLLAAAEARGLSVIKADATALPFEDAFDAVFSNAVLHWVLDAETAARSIRKSLRKRGRFVAEFGGHGNVAAIVTGLRAAARQFGGDEALAAPWFYPTAEEYKEILAQAGLRVQRIMLLPRPTPLPTGLAGWLTTFREPFFSQFAEPDRQKVRDWVVSLLKPALCSTSGQWTADYVRLRVEAVAV